MNHLGKDSSRYISVLAIPRACSTQPLHDIAHHRVPSRLDLSSLPRLLKLDRCPRALLLNYTWDFLQLSMSTLLLCSFAAILVASGARP